MDARQGAERTPLVVYARAAAIPAAAPDEGSRTIEFVASTEDIDSHGSIVRQNWRLDRFQPTGPVLYAHDSDELPIGTATVRVEDNKLLASVTFSTADLNPQAEQVYRNVKAGVLRGISVGFMPHSVTCDTVEDRSLVVLDDNELIELSVTPCPSNANAIAQMRSMFVRAAPEPQPEAAPEPATAPEPPPPAAVEPNQPAERGGEISMSERIQDPTNTVTVARALGLPVGATEQDAVAAAVRLREIDLQLLAISGAKTSDEAIGAIRAMAGAARDLKAANEDLAKLRAERDSQNFETLVQKGIAEHKLTPAEEKYERDLFAKAIEQNRGAARVEELRGFLNVKASDPRFSRNVAQPAAGAASVVLLHNGKTYSELRPAQRAVLARENPELWQLMKADFEAQRV